MLYNFRRQASRRVDKLVYRIGTNEFAAALNRVGFEAGTCVCVHSALSGLGYFAGGPETLVDTIMQAAGDRGSILMPSFPTDTATVRYLDSGQVFDVRTSPSKVGRLTELFRNRPEVRRSLHPTNPVCAWGRTADTLIEGHENSITPYGAETPYGRLSESEDTFILMLNTHVHSYLHHIQERAGFPNLYLPEARDVPYVDWSGANRTMRTKIMRPRIPYYVSIPARSGDAPDWAVLHDFTLLFPRDQRRRVRKLGYRFDGYGLLFRRAAEFERLGILRTTKLGKGQIGLLRVKPFTEHIVPEMRDLIERFRPYYDCDRIAALNLPYT